MINMTKFAKKLVDMKNTAKQAKEQTGAPVSSSREKYPYGLSISLEKEQIKKLGIKMDGLKVGKKGKLTAEYEITSISERQTQGGDDSQSMQLQITKMAVE